MWHYTDLEGSAAPRQFTSQIAYTAFFGPAGDVLYAGVDDVKKEFALVYRVKQDGSDLRR
jgi:hypothetical protein